MPLKFCLPQRPPQQRKCWFVPVLIVKYPRPEPDPFFKRVVDAFRLVIGPQPEPWAPGDLANSGLREETIRDVRILATIDELATKLSPAVRGAVSQSLQSASQGLTLPQGADLTIAA